MGEYSLHDVEALGETSQSPRRLNDRLWNLLSHSVDARVKIESCNWQTGEYRVVLQGTLDVEPPDRAATA